MGPTTAEGQNSADRPFSAAVFTRYPPHVSATKNEIEAGNCTQHPHPCGDTRDASKYASRPAGTSGPSNEGSGAKHKYVRETAKMVRRSAVSPAGVGHALYPADTAAWHTSTATQTAGAPAARAYPAGTTSSAEEPGVRNCWDICAG